MENSAVHYVSCVVIRGRPILPPVMTAFRYAEMRRYKELALAVEAKYGRRKRASAAVSHAAPASFANYGLQTIAGTLDTRKTSKVQETGPKSPLGSLLFAKLQGNAKIEDTWSSPCVTCESPPMNSTYQNLSTPPSVASTDLERYMSMRLESECQDLIPELETHEGHFHVCPILQAVSSCSSTVTVTPDGPNVPPDVSQLEEDFAGGQDDFSACGHHRRSSYTLDLPSPVLLAHFQKLAVESGYGEAGGEISAKIQTNYLPSDSAVSREADNSTSQDFDSETNLCIREQHLHRYLQEVALFSAEDCPDFSSASQESYSFVGKHFNERDQTPSGSVVSKLLNEQESSFNELIEASRAKLNCLRERQEVKLKLIHCELKNDPSLQVEETDSPHSEGFLLTSEDSFLGVVGKREESAKGDPRGFCSNASTKKSSRSPPSDSARFESPKTCPEKAGQESKDGQWRLSQNDFTRYPGPSLKFERLSAAVKGFLTRRLLRTEKVQTIIQTIKDTLEFALQLHSETPVKQGWVTSQDASLHQRLIAQLSGACFEFHDIFFKLKTAERMKIIAQDRISKLQKVKQKSRTEKPAVNKRQNRRLSSATLKLIERKRHHGRQSSSPLGTYTFGGRSPRCRIFNKGYKRILSNAFDQACAQSSLPRFASAHGQSKCEQLSGKVEFQIFP